MQRASQGFAPLAVQTQPLEQPGNRQSHRRSRPAAALQVLEQQIALAQQIAAVVAAEEPA